MDEPSVDTLFFVGEINFVGVYTCVFSRIRIGKNRIGNQLKKCVQKRDRDTWKKAESDGKMEMK